MERVFRTRNFTRWMRKSGLTDAALCKAVKEMVAGLVDADLLARADAQLAKAIDEGALQEIFP